MVSENSESSFSDDPQEESRKLTARKRQKFKSWKQEAGLFMKDLWLEVFCVPVNGLKTKIEICATFAQKHPIISLLSNRLHNKKRIFEIKNKALTFLLIKGFKRLHQV
jgi:hypothetical protein